MEELTAAVGQMVSGRVPTLDRPLETFLEVSGGWLLGGAALKPVRYQPTWPFETDGQSYHHQEVWWKVWRQLKDSLAGMAEGPRWTEVFGVGGLYMGP